MMPPANSPTDEGRSAAPAILTPTTASRSSSSATLLPALRELTAQVPDFAATFTNEDEDDVDAANVSFLRTRLDPADQMSAEDLNRELRQSRRRRLRESRDQALQERPAATDGRRERERRFQDATAGHLRQIRETDRVFSRLRSPYGDGVPDAQSLYDWAPASQEDEQTDISNLLSELQQQQPNTHPDLLQRLAEVEARYRRYRSRTSDNSSTNDSNVSSQNNSTNDRDGLNLAIAPRHQDVANITNNSTSFPPRLPRSTDSSDALLPPGPPAPQHHEPSLRSAAILQSVRRNQQLSTRTMELMNRHILDRARAMHEGSSRDRRNLEPWQRLSNSLLHERSRYEVNRMAWQASQQRSNDQSGGSAMSQRENLETLRRRYLDNPTSKPSEFEETIKYMHFLRSPDHEFEKQLSQLGSCLNVLNKTTSRIRLDRDFVLTMAAVCPPHPTSWLTPGTLFSGFQQAASIQSNSASLYRLANSSGLGSANPLLQRRRPSSSSTSIISPDGPTSWLGQDLTTTPLRFASTSPVISASPSSSPSDRWTVKVAIHSVDYETMTLQGTMEAYNVPSTPATMSPSAAAAAKTTFSTYLEGELIDFTHHTLLTETNFNVKTTPDIDATYWRQLEPFSKMTDDQIANALLDRDWIENDLMGQYVLMRWKERCFVQPTFTSGSSLSTPSSATSSRRSSVESASERRQSYQQPPRDATTGYLSGADGNGYGLSISGFYYVSMRRRDGHCEGLYHDPQSSPYQQLQLKPSEGMWGSGVWEFR